MRIACAAVLMASVPALLSSPLDDGLARTPPMGWNSWETFRLRIDEVLIRSTADAIAASGMKDAGYRYVVVDAGWKDKTRNADGTLAVDADKFPSGMKALGDYIHSKGLLFGLYTDAGDRDCVAGTPGSKGHEAVDASTFATWGADFVKEDWCNSEGLDAREAYTKMSEALLATGRPILFSLCEWGDNQPWNWAAAVGHMWRTTGDNKPCWDCGRDTMSRKGGYPRGWTLILDAQPPLAAFAGPGHWNDPDMLEVGQRGMSLEESRAHFSLWAILAAPLIATNDLRSMPPEIASILLNREVIAVDQDSMGIEGTRVSSEGGLEIWARRLADGGRAVVLFNRTAVVARIAVRWTDIGFRDSDRLRVRDLWRHADAGAFRREYSDAVPPHGAVMIRVGRQ